MTLANRFGACLGAGLAIGLGLTPAIAADFTYVGPAYQAAEVTTPSGWRFTVAPYGWLAGISGEVTLGTLPPVDVDVSFGDILDKFQIGAMVIGEARIDRFGIFSDIMFARLSSTDDTPLGLFADQTTVTNRTLIWSELFEYRFVDTPTVSVDALAGFRLWSFEADVSFIGGALGGNTANRSRTWIDPLIGIKAAAELSPKFYLTGWAMAGGFGVGSNFTWDVWGGAGYRFTDRFSALAGYRALGVDYGDNGVNIDAVLHGPVLGASFRF